MLLALGFSKQATLAFVMAAGFIADTASLPLIVSNLVNIVSADFFALGFSEYASVMIPVDIAAIAATLVMLHLFFRKEIPPEYDPRNSVSLRGPFTTSRRSERAGSSSSFCSSVSSCLNLSAFRSAPLRPSAR